MITGHLEVERKYAADDDVDLPPLTQLLAAAGENLPWGGAPVVDGEVVEHELSATYFDTEDLRLARAGLTLRRRTGGDDAGWHLKVPAGEGARSEVRLPSSGAAGTVPTSLRRMVRARTAEAPLKPIATIATARTVRRLVDATGQVLVELADDRVTGRRLLQLKGGAGTAAGAALTWREVELELIAGRPELLEKLDSALRERGLRDSPSANKLLKVVGDSPSSGDLAAAAPLPGKRSDRELNRRSPGGEVLVAYLAAQVDEILRQDLPVRLDGPGSLHKMRVATRRVRSALSAFRPLVDHDVTDPLRKELKWLAGQLGDARDAEVMRDRLHAAAQADGAAADHGPVDTVDSQLGVAYRRAHDHVLAELDSERYHALLGNLRALVGDPPFTADASRPARKVLTKRVRRSWSRLKAIMDHASKPDSGAERDQVLHEARKAAKRARYAGEALAPAFGADAERFAAAMENLQEVLGEHQDSVLTRQRLHELATVAPTNEAAFVYGRLHAIEEARAENAADAVREAWAKARRKRLRDWL